MARTVGDKTLKIKMLCVPTEDVKCNVEFWVDGCVNKGSNCDVTGLNPTISILENAQSQALWKTIVVIMGAPDQNMFISNSWSAL